MPPTNKPRRLTRRLRTAPAPSPVKSERRSPNDPHPTLPLSNDLGDDLTFDDTSDEELEDRLEEFNNWAGFQVSRALPRCDERKHTLRDLMGLLDVPNGIDLSPEYQRDFVWNAETQVGLIDSIFQGYYVPGLIFNKRVETVLGVRKETLVCIDGKQRLTSVKRFTEGQIPCRDRLGRKWWFRQAVGSSKVVRGRKYLPEAAKAELWKKTFTCYQYVGMTEAQERDLFQRVQRGCPLTLAERAQAKDGDWQDLARRFQKDFPRVVDLCDSTRARGYANFASSFVQIIERPREVGIASEAPFKGTEIWVEKYFVRQVEDHPCTPEIQARLERVFDRFDELARLNPRAFANDGLGKVVALAPIEFIATAYMIDRHSDQPNAKLEMAIRAMIRKARRDHPNDVRRKPMVWKTLLVSMQESFDSIPIRIEKRPLPSSPELSQRRLRQSFGLD